jgi:4-hydroxy-2-oxoglutarate aldolase
MQRELGGIIIPAVTPFEEDGRISYEKMELNIQKWNQTDISGIMVLGTNGEFKALSDDESFDVIHFFCDHVSADKMIIAGVGRESLYQTLKMIDRLWEAKLRVDYVSVLTPNYFAKLMTDEALVNFYEKIADHSPYPVLLYCAPSYSNSVCLSVDAVKKLADHPNIKGIKDTSSNMMESYMSALAGRNDFEVLAGSLSNIMTCLKMGGHGGVVSAANYFPDECARLTAIFEENGYEAAAAYHSDLQALSKKTGAVGGVAGVKACMNAVGYAGGFPRLPILPLSDERVEEIKKIVENR